MKKRATAAILAAIICLLLTPTAVFAGVGDGDWTNGWDMWDQKQSTSASMRRWGSLVVAQAKLLCCTGIVSDESFDPDVYYAWLQKSKLIDSDMIMKRPYDGPCRYAKIQGGKLSCIEEKGTGEDLIWANIDAGKYTILGRETPSVGYALVNNEASKAQGKIQVYASLGVDDNGHEYGKNPGTQDWDAVTTEVWTYTLEGPVAVTCSLDVSGWLDGKKLDNLSGVGTFDAYINGKRTGNNVTKFHRSSLTAGTKYEIKDVKAAQGFEYVGVRSGSLKGTLKGSVSVVLEFRKKDTPMFTFTNDNTVTEVGQTSARIGCFNIYFSGDISQVKKVGCQLLSADGKNLAGVERDAIVSGDHLVHSFRIAADAGKEDIEYELTPGTEYKVRVYVIYDGQKYYSDLVPFKTQHAAPPTSYGPRVPTTPPGRGATPTPFNGPVEPGTPGPTVRMNAYVTIVNVKNKLSVRKNASDSTKRLGYAYNGEVYPLLAVKGDWYKIQYSATVVGYVKGAYVIATNEHMVPHYYNEYDDITPKPTKKPTPKPTPTKEVYVTEPPPEPTNTPTPPPVTEPPITEPPVTEAPVTPTPGGMIWDWSTEAPIDTPAARNEDEGPTPTHPSKTAKPAEADARRTTRKPSAGRGEEEEEGGDNKDSRLAVALIGIGGVFVASQAGIAAIVIHRRRSRFTGPRYE